MRSDSQPGVVVGGERLRDEQRDRGEPTTTRNAGGQNAVATASSDDERQVAVAIRARPPSSSSGRTERVISCCEQERRERVEHERPEPTVRRARSRAIGLMP